MVKQATSELYCSSDSGCVRFVVNVWFSCKYLFVVNELLFSITALLNTEKHSLQQKLTKRIQSLQFPKSTTSASIEQDIKVGVIQKH